MMGLGGSPMGVMGAPGQQGANPQGNNPLGAMNLGMQGVNGMPMSFMIPQQQQQQQQQGDQKNGDKNAPQKPVDAAKKNESGKKDDKPDIFPPPIDPNTAKNAPIPSFLSPQGQFTPMIPTQNKDQKGPAGQQGPMAMGMMPKMAMGPGGQMPQIISMPGMPGAGGMGGMMLTPEMFQQLQQSGGQSGQLPQGIMLPQGIGQLPQGLGQLPQNLPPGITMIPGTDPMAGMTPEQKQQMMMQLQMKMGFPPGMPPQQPKKDEEKK